MSLEREVKTTTIHVELETLAAIAAAVGKEHDGKVTADDVNQVAARHCEVEQEFLVEGHEVAVAEWLDENTDLEIQ